MADTKNVFAVLEKETGGSWNIARNKVLAEIGLKSNTKAADDILKKYEKNPDKKQAQKSAYDSVLSDIKSTLIKGKDLKRGDFLDAVKKAEDIGVGTRSSNWLLISVPDVPAFDHSCKLLPQLHSSVISYKPDQILWQTPASVQEPSLQFYPVYTATE